MRRDVPRSDRKRAVGARARRAKRKPTLGDAQNSNFLDTSYFITDQGNAFEPSFELDTDDHAEWVRDALAAFEKAADDK